MACTSRGLWEGVGKAARSFSGGLEAGLLEERGHIKAFVLQLSHPPSGSGVGFGGLWGYCPGHTSPGSAGLSPILCVSGEATWSGSEFEVSFPDSPGAPAQQDHLPQLTLPDSLTSAASPEDGLSAELLEAQAEEEPAGTASPDRSVEAEAEAKGAASPAQLSTPK